jgi:hypothetical protein
MELLLNLIWLALATGALLGFVCSQRGSARMTRVSYRKSLVALASAVVLLFPIVSASDDLHPAQAVVEDATKRIQLAVAPLHAVRASAPLSMMSAMPALCMMPALVALGRLEFPAPRTRVFDSAVTASAGRAPPSAWS